MKKLLKVYGLQSQLGYYEMIAESFLNGQYQQAIEQFRAMPRKNRVEMLKASTTNWRSGLAEQNLKRLFDSIL